MTRKDTRQAEQFLANFEAWREHCHAPSIQLTGSLSDRCEFCWTPEWQVFCEHHTDRQDIGISAHENFLGVSLEGYRDKKYSIAGIQLIKRRSPDGYLRIEADLDWGVPTDLLGVFVHLFRDFAPNKLFGRRTNQIAMARYLRCTRKWKVRDVRKESKA